MCWNVWSILNEKKLNHLLQVFDDNNIMIASISETWFDSKEGIYTANIRNAGYDILHAHREDKRGGGVMIIYKKTLKGKAGDASCSKFSSFEYSYMTFTAAARTKVLLVSLYRKQEIACGVFIQELQIFIDTIFCKGDVIIFTGDFNVWADTINTDSSNLLDLMSSFGLSQLVADPTHRCGHTLDHIYVNTSQISLTVEVSKEKYGITTDHFPISFTIPLSKKELLKKTICFRNSKNMECRKFVQRF